MALCSSTNCLGITKKGTACKKKVISGYYCRFHATDLVDDNDSDLYMQSKIERQTHHHKNKPNCKSDLPREEKSTEDIESFLYLKLQHLEHQVFHIEKTLLEQQFNDTGKPLQLQDDEP